MLTNGFGIDVATGGAGARIGSAFFLDGRVDDVRGALAGDLFLQEVHIVRLSRTHGYFLGGHLDLNAVGEDRGFAFAHHLGAVVAAFDADFDTAGHGVVTVLQDHFGHTVAGFVLVFPLLHFFTGHNAFGGLGVGRCGQHAERGHRAETDRGVAEEFTNRCRHFYHLSWGWNLRRVAPKWRWIAN